MTVARVGARTAIENFSGRVGPTDEEIFYFGKLLAQLTESRPLTAIREGCSRRPYGSETTDNQGSLGF